MDFISILILLGVVLVCAVLLLPFYIFHKKEKSVPIEVQRGQVSVPLARALFLVVAEGVLFLLVLAYFVLKAEGVIPSNLGWGAAASAVGVIWLHAKNKKIAIVIKKSESGFLGWTLVAYVKHR